MPDRRILSASLVLLLVLGGCSPGEVDSARVRATSSPQATAPTEEAVPATEPASPTAVPVVTPAPHEFDVAGAMEHTRVLSEEIGTRHAGTQGDERAASYARSVLDGLGYEARFDPFGLPQGGESQNVIGAPPGFAFDERYLIVGGHIDSLNGPGANDNATGVGVALEIARALTRERAALPVVVIAFGAEERQPAEGRPHHIGSRHYVDAMDTQERNNLVAFVNLDMVGWGDGLIAGRLNEGPREATERLLRFGRELSVPIRERVTPDWSDNGPFLKADLNAGWLWSGDDPRYHSVRDTFDHLQQQPVDWAGRVALATLRSYS